MSKCSVCGRKVSSKTAHFGLGCLKNMCTIIGIEKVGVSHNIKSENNLITLNQAYQAFKLYNKFEKIKNTTEEVDNEYIQNFLFDNLSFAFSTYYRNKKYLNGIILEIQRYFWRMIVTILKEKYPLGTEFIDYSLQENPKDRVITQGRIIEDIVKDSRFKEKINQIIKDNDNKSYFNVTSGLNYASTDLFLALNNTTINVIGNKEENKWKLNITIKFTIDNWNK